MVAIKSTASAHEPSPAQLQIAAALAELDDDRIRIAPVPAVYPIGGEAQLIEQLTKREIPSGGLPWDTGVACQNVGTAAAIAQFFYSAEPLLSRIVTVTGGGIVQPVNVVARIGTPFQELIELAGGYTSNAARLIVGGPMMGEALPSDELPVTKATNCIYVASRDELTTIGPEMPCIRCSDCASVCPVNLSPQFLLQAQRGSDLDNVEHLGVMDCIECGCCDYVCPSHIPLTKTFHHLKRDIWSQRAARRNARRAEQRFNARNARLARIESEQSNELERQLAVFTTSPSDNSAALDELKQRLNQRARGNTSDNSSKTDAQLGKSGSQDDPS